MNLPMSSKQEQFLTANILWGQQNKAWNKKQFCVVYNVFYTNWTFSWKQDDKMQKKLKTNKKYIEFKYKTLNPWNGSHPFLGLPPLVNKLPLVHLLFIVSQFTLVNLQPLVNLPMLLLAQSTPPVLYTFCDAQSPFQLHCTYRRARCTPTVPYTCLVAEWGISLIYCAIRHAHKIQRKQWNFIESLWVPTPQMCSNGGLQACSIRISSLRVSGLPWHGN